MLQVFAARIAAALNSRKGISALEYAILAGALLGLVSACVTTFGANVNSLFNSTGAALTAAADKAN